MTFVRDLCTARQVSFQTGEQLENYARMGKNREKIRYQGMSCMTSACCGKYFKNGFIHFNSSTSFIQGVLSLLQKVGVIQRTEKNKIVT